MHLIEIDSFRRVIMREMQRTGKTTLTFASTWKVCADSARNLPDPIDPEKDKQKFSARLFDELRMLGNHGFVAVHFKPGNNQVSHITLMSKGERVLKTTTYTHQYRTIPNNAYDGNSRRDREMAEQALRSADAH